MNSISNAGGPSVKDEVVNPNEGVSVAPMSGEKGMPESRYDGAGIKKYLKRSNWRGRKWIWYVSAVWLLLFVVLPVLCQIVPGASSARWRAAKAAAETQFWASLGSVKAQYDFACFNEHGYGVPKDERQAIRWYTKAAERGDVLAQCDLASGYAYRFAHRDVNEAIYWYTKAAEQGCVAAQYSLGHYLCVLARDGATVDFDEVEKWWTMAAEGGCAEAQYSTFEFIVKKGGDDNSWAKALPWLKKAADQGLGCAQYEMGHAYKCGLGVERNDDEAAKWYRLAYNTFLQEANMGNPDLRARALCCLAYMWEHQDAARDGRWPEANRKTFELYREAALLGSIPAQYKLSVCYSAGIGVERNEAEALAWCTKAAEQGHEMATVALIKRYTEPVYPGSHRNEQEAAKWAERNDGGKYALANFALIGWQAYLLPF